MKKNEKNFFDPYLRKLQDYRPRSGMSAFDVYRTSPGPHIPLNEEIGGRDNKFTTMPRMPNELLCTNALLGDDNGRAKHLAPGQKGFIGLSAGNLEDGKVRIRQTGRFFFKVPGATNQDRGKVVYSSGPAGPFSLEPSVNTYAIGRIRFVEPNDERASVAVFPYNYTGPVDLHIDGPGGY